ncbi:hypothetical protein ANCCEY_08856 [Ancylostoma ceylanicum]|uniref:Uncharacterized protein n=1 Tax=Ancylostoma ceylanicum TaxID=53326 RepID=A0A0D6LPW7_9BILA|nr:hypothetical protein ANCCEY_08856 [Ancylostoma ceylanicum]
MHNPTTFGPLDQFVPLRTFEEDVAMEASDTEHEEMNDVVGAQSSAGWAMNPAVQHTLRRHREILRDYGTEFRRARDNVQQQLQRFHFIFTFHIG